MKTQHKLALLALGLATVTSCAKHDPIADTMDIGQPVPTCYWSVGSTACKAGESFSFTGKYYTDDDHTPDHAEVWYEVKRTESSGATVGLTGSTLAFTLTVNTVNTDIPNQAVASFAHADSLWNGYEFELNGSVGTSTNWSPVEWKNVGEWTAETDATFANYFESANELFPNGFQAAFCDTVTKILTKDSTNMAALKAAFANHPFTVEELNTVNAAYPGLNLPAIPDSINAEDPQVAINYKNNNWYVNKEVVIGWHYNAVDSLGNIVDTFVATEQVEPNEDGYSAVLKADANVKCYAVYESSPWLYCRYDDDAGSVLTAVKRGMMDAFVQLLGYIEFPEWIYSKTDGEYQVSFTREYSLDAQFKVYDTVGNIGTASDTRTISIN